MVTEEVRTVVVRWPRWQHGGRSIELAWMAGIERVANVSRGCWIQLGVWEAKGLRVTATRRRFRSCFDLDRWIAICKD
ncbi:hypothetical protein V6N11_036491 [Hibiscus sabdariffa]|uniref:Uncharacterized protein n=1 Tax=Hibiscus sabdariffa TaxID=183260 RepID=A0ABR2RAK2_9ROSI